MTLGARLSFQEERPDFAGLSDRCECGFVKFLVGLVGVFKNLPAKFRRHEADQFVGGEHVENVVREA